MTATHLKYADMPKMVRVKSVAATNKNSRIWLGRGRPCSKGGPTERRGVVGRQLLSSMYHGAAAAARPLLLLLLLLLLLPRTQGNWRRAQRAAWNGACKQGVASQQATHHPAHSTGTGAMLLVAHNVGTRCEAATMTAL